MEFVSAIEKCLPLKNESRMIHLVPFTIARWPGCQEASGFFSTGLLGSGFSTITRSTSVGKIFTGYRVSKIYISYIGYSLCISWMHLHAAFLVRLILPLKY